MRFVPTPLKPAVSNNEHIYLRSDTGPGEGTLRVYPDVQLSNSYLILRPFFSLVDPHGDIWDKNNWKFGMCFRDRNTPTV